jgi:hypothetical protein
MAHSEDPDPHHDRIARAAERLHAASERASQAQELLTIAKERLAQARHALRDARASNAPQPTTDDSPRKPGKTP